MGERATQEPVAAAATAEQEVVLFHVVCMDFVRDNYYAMGGARPNAKFIASQHGCRLEFRDSQFRTTGNLNYTPDWLRRYGIDTDGSCQSTVLVGKTREQLMKAREDILMTFGAAPLNLEGHISVGRE